MWENGTSVGLSIHFLRFTRTLGAFVVFWGLLVVSEPVRADVISNAVLNYGGGVWAAYTSEPYDGISQPYSPTESISLTVSDTPPVSADEIDDSSGNEYLDDDYNPNCTFDLNINLTDGNVTSGELTEVTGDGYWDPTFTDFTPVTPFTIYSSNDLVEFGEEPGGGSDPGYYWFAFQNGSNPNSIIGGYIDPGDVKTFEVNVPEPSSAILILGSFASALGTRRFRRNAKFLPTSENSL
jgi:hypothetical protein